MQFVAVYSEIFLPTCQNSFQERMHKIQDAATPNKSNDIINQIVSIYEVFHANGKYWFTVMECYSQI